MLKRSGVIYSSLFDVFLSSSILSILSISRKQTFSPTDYFIDPIAHAEKKKSIQKGRQIAIS